MNPLENGGLYFPEQGPIYPGPRYPGNGYPPNPGEDRPGLSAFGRLAKGQPLGKSSILLYSATNPDPQFADNENLRLEGDDLDACQLVVTLSAPRVLPIAYADIEIDVASSPSNAQSNFEVTTGDFPGLGTPIIFPPFQAVVQWGVRGSQAQAVVDWVNGVAFSVCASYLSVIGVVTQGASVGVAGTSAAYQLAANVGPGWTKGNARRTIRVGSVPDSTESNVFPVPMFAAKVLPFGTINTVAPVLPAGFIRFFSSPEGVAGAQCTGCFFWSANANTPIEIPAGSLYFSMYPQSGVTLELGASFELALG
jgi:hypothetical protein